MPLKVHNEDFRLALENEFFLNEDKKLIDQLKKMRQMKETKETLMAVSGIRNDAVLEKLVTLNIRPEMLASLSLVPLVEVAWADGGVDEKERKSVMAAVKSWGMTKDSVDYTLLDAWLTHRPSSHLLEAWVHFVQGLCEDLTDEEVRILKEELVLHTRAIAEVSGGFLGLIGKVSESEDKVLKQLEKAFPEK